MMFFITTWNKSLIRSLEKRTLKLSTETWGRNGTRRDAYLSQNFSFLFSFGCDFERDKKIELNLEWIKRLTATYGMKWSSGKRCTDLWRTEGFFGAALCATQRFGIAQYSNFGYTLHCMIVIFNFFEYPFQCPS